MKKIIFAVSLVLFAGYHIKAIDTSLVRYMPLNAGNVYVYSWYVPQYFTGHVRVMFTKDTVANGKKYYVDEFQIDHPGYGTNPFAKRYLRYDSITADLIGYSGTGECVIDSFSSKKNDTSQTCNGRLICIDTGNIILFNSYSTFIKDFNDRSLSSYADFYAKNIGMYYACRGEFGPQYTLIGCVVGGILYGDTTFFTGIKPISSELPDNYILYQNYPNPFNPGTKIKFSIPFLPLDKGEAEGVVRLTIYDNLGREVATLVNEKLSPGTYEVEWDASNYPSGVYFYKFTSGDFSQTKKMLLIK